MEGTAFTALMYRLLGDEDSAVVSINALSGVRLGHGLFPAATVEGLPTGFGLFTGAFRNYGSDSHVAPTAWFTTAVNGFDPYKF